MPASFLRQADGIGAFKASGEKRGTLTYDPHRLLPYRLTYTTDPQHVTTREDRP